MNKIFFFAVLVVDVFCLRVFSNYVAFESGLWFQWAALGLILLQTNLGAIYAWTKSKEVKGIIPLGIICIFVLTTALFFIALLLPHETSDGALRLLYLTLLVAVLLGSVMPFVMMLDDVNDDWLGSSVRLLASFRTTRLYNVLARVVLFAVVMLFLGSITWWGTLGSLY